MKKLVCLILCIAVLFMMAGCGSSGQSSVSPGPETVSEPEPETDAGTEPATETEPVEETIEETEAGPSYEITDGPIFIRADGKDAFDEWSLHMLSLKTGEDIVVFQYDESSIIGRDNHELYFTTSLWDNQSFLHEQLFDSKLERVAVYWGDSSDNSRHVGWVDRDGQLTDVTNIIHPATSGFSSVTPQDREALFTSDDRLFFYDDNEDVWCYYDDATQTVENYEWNLETDPYYNVGNGLVGLTPEDRPCAQRTVMFGDEYLLSFYPYGMGVKSVIANDYVLLPDGGISFLIAYPDKIQHFGKGVTDAVDSKYYSYQNAVTITPPTEYKIDSLAYSSYDGGSIVFTASRGKEDSVFLMTYRDLAAGEPELLTSYDPDREILCFWKG